MELRSTFIDRLLEKRVLRHVLFWVLVVISAPLFSEFDVLDVWDSFIMRLVNMPLKIIATYSLVYFQIPFLLRKKRYFYFIISFVLIAFFFTVLYRLNNIYIAETMIGSTDPKESLGTILSQWKFTFFAYFYRVYFFGFLFLLVKMVKDRIIERNKLETLLKEKAETELNFLKAQIHPHFLFNTLNNLYALTLEKSDDAPQVVAKLSEILDYMLYQCNDDQVLLSKEVELIQHYIDLEKLRYGDRLELSFHHSIDDPQAKIAPLVLLSIIENAFKHGVSGAFIDPFVRIDLEVNEGILNFEVLNSKPAVVQSDEQDYRKGIGVANTKRQLELIYPGSYSWEVVEGHDTYQVLLSLAL